ncbi:pinopsin-like [Oculina patagonica]
MRSVFTVFAVLSSIIGASGAILNFLVCLLYFTTPRLLDAPNVFILNIAIGNLMYSIVALPLVVTSNVRGEWSFGDAGCTVYAFLTTFFGLGSMMHLAGAAYERYFTICRLYNDGENQFGQKKAIILSVMLWCYSLFWSLMPLLGWSSFEQEGIGTSCSVNWRSREAGDASFTVCLMLACFVLPVTVIIYCYYKTYKAMSELTKQAVQNWGENSGTTQDTLQAERKMARITVTITTGYLIAWTPYALSSTIAILNSDLISDIGASIPAYLAKSSACFNPIIHALLYKTMRERLVEVFCCKRGRVHPDAPTNSRMETYRKSRTTQTGNQQTISAASTGRPATV